jgi:hypothetical protein
MARSVGSAIDEGDPAEPECPLFLPLSGENRPQGGRRQDHADDPKRTLSIVVELNQRPTKPHDLKLGVMRPGRLLVGRSS